MVFNSIILFVLGTVFGSFYYVVGTRLPNHESLIKPGSHCTYCNHVLKWYELIPIFSFLFLRGRCHHCKQKLSKEYLLYELLTGILFLISYLKFHFSYAFFVSLILASLLVLIFITDFKYMIILDSPLVISAILLFGLRFYYFGLANAFLNVLYGFLSFLVLLFIGYLGSFLFKRDALGGGDVKFSFILGMALGFKYAIMALIFSTFLALPYAVGTLLLKKDNEVPFGPFLVSSAFIIYFFIEKFSLIFYLF